MRPIPDLLRSISCRLAVPAAVTVLMLGLLVVWRVAAPPPAKLPQEAASTASGLQVDGPPWRYGSADARFTVILYADLECPYCRSYFPVLKGWIDTHPEVNGQWHHLLLAAHEPAATAQARLAECAGEDGGHPAFFEAIDWIYRHTRGGGQGIPDALRYPGLTPALRACLASDRPQAIIQAQADEGARDGIAATPAVRLTDRVSGKSMLLHGPVEGDALLSAFDLLAADAPATTQAPGATESAAMPAAPVGDMPR